MKTILLTGPAGSVGSETLKRLLQKRSEIKLKLLEMRTLKNIKKLRPFQNRTEIIWGDIRDKTVCEKAIKDVDVIIHTAALIPPKADEFPKLADEINYGGTKNLIDSLNKQNTEAFFIYTSSISVYGDRLSNPEITIFDKLNPSSGDRYAETKIKAEDYIKMNVKNFTIYRLSAVMDLHMKLNPLFFHMPLETPLEIVTSSDVANALVKSVDKQPFLNERIFNLSGGKNCRITYKQFLDRNFNAFGLKNADFPAYAFAEKNFHCAYYKDSYQLNNILNFQTETVEDYLNKVYENIDPVKRFFAGLFRKAVLRNLLKKSEPYSSYISGNIKMVKHFFHSENLSYTKVI